MTDSHFPKVIPVSRGSEHHFFGYYDKSPWDASGRFMLAGEVDFCDREPTGNDPLTVGVIDLEDDCSFRPVGESRAWCWQTGCMMQWLPPEPGGRVIYNDRRHDRFVSVILDVATGDERVLTRPVLALSHDGKRALCVNMSRLDDMRPGYGYPGLSDPNLQVPAPDDDGVWVMDLLAGESRLVVSYARILADYLLPGMEGTKHWVNHLEFNPGDTRFTIIHRWAEADDDGRRLSTWGNQFLSANVDGSELHCFDLDGLISHYDWRDDETILGWTKPHDGERRYALIEDLTQNLEIVGEGVLDCDGHCSYSPDRRWVLTDTYPQGDDLVRTLLLYHPATGKRIDIGRFREPPSLWEARTRRCDLHPRWRRDGKAVCVDCVIDGVRTMAVLDVSDIVSKDP